MCKNIINELLQNGLGYLTAICARPGDGRMSLAISLANELAQRGETVYFYSFPQPTVSSIERLSHKVQILMTPPSFTTDIQPNAIVIIDHLSAATRTMPPCQNHDTKNSPLQHFKKMSVEKNLQLIVTDTFRRADDSDDKLPLSNAAVALCDHVYVLFKKAYWSTDPEDPYAGIPMLRQIK